MNIGVQKNEVHAVHTQVKLLHVRFGNLSWSYQKQWTKYAG